MLASDVDQARFFQKYALIIICDSQTIIFRRFFEIFLYSSDAVMKSNTTERKYYYKSSECEWADIHILIINTVFWQADIVRDFCNIACGLYFLAVLEVAIWQDTSTFEILIRYMLSHKIRHFVGLTRLSVGSVAE